MGKRLVQTKRGGLAVIDGATNRDDFGDADSILSGWLSCRRTNNEVHKIWTWVRQRMEGGFRLTEADIPEGGTDDRQRAKSRLAHIGEDVIWVDVGRLWQSSADAGCLDYIVLNMDCGPAGAKGEVCSTPTECADDQVSLGIARFAEPWEVLAGAITPEPDRPAWARGLDVAKSLHGPTFVRSTGDGGAAWPN